MNQTKKNILTIACGITFLQVLGGCNNVGNTSNIMNGSVNQTVTTVESPNANSISNLSNVADDDKFVNPNDPKNLYAISINAFKQANNLNNLPNFPHLSSPRVSNNNTSNWLDLSVVKNESNNIMQISLTSEPALYMLDTSGGVYSYNGISDIQQVSNSSKDIISSISPIPYGSNFVGTQLGTYGQLFTDVYMPSKTVTDIALPIIAIENKYAMNSKGDLLIMDICQYQTACLQKVASINQPIVSGLQDYTSDSVDFYAASSNNVYHIDKNYTITQYPSLPKQSGYADVITSIGLDYNTHELYVGTFLGYVYKANSNSNNPWTLIGDSIDYTMIANIIINNNQVYVVTSDAYTSNLYNFKNNAWQQVNPDNIEFYQFGVGVGGDIFGVAKNTASSVELYRYNPSSFSIVKDTVVPGLNTCQYTLKGYNFTSTKLTIQKISGSYGDVSFTDDCNNLLKNQCTIHLEFNRSAVNRGSYSGIISDGVTNHTFNLTCGNYNADLSITDN